MAKRVLLTIDDPDYSKLDKAAREKYPGAPGRIQKLIRFNVIPDWLRENGDKK
jgi:hypothetical protein